MKIGLIVNPVAGMGGRVGLKGSDGEEIHKKALALGAQPVSPKRTIAALEALQEIREEIQLFTYPKEMGGEEAEAAGFKPEVLGSIISGKTRPEDTILAARDMAARGVDLILFTGGDGTARNIYDAIADKIPVLGIPGGVKIHSGVYAANPEKAARLIIEFMKNPAGISLRSAEVMDIDEDLIRQDRVSARLYGYLTVPHRKGLNQASKAGSDPSDAVHHDGIAMEVINGMEKDTLYLFAPGTTTKAVTDKLELPGTLLGIDAVKNRILVGKDLSEERILSLMAENPKEPCKIIVTIIGKQGYLFGRGNQQLSPAVIRRVGKENLLVIATQNKLLSLENEPILVDTGDPELDKSFEGYIPVIIGIGKRMVYPVSR